MQSRLRRHGHSQAVLIPAQFLKKLNVKKGDLVIVDFDFAKARVTISFPGARQLRLEVPRNGRSRVKKDSPI